ncbi:IS256 family transposase [Tomitella gaofuii]|uniref:IS256 family transposase n=1 Tax=Tomitella gaofuii TaxID=2760083 RepID=UPI0015FE5DEA|nr:IS256 family transposase [Tomitella gaofuii]
MAMDQSALLEITRMLQSADDGTMIRTLLATFLQVFVDAEATAHIGADRYQRSDTRTTSRNGTRDKTITTTSGDVTVKIPKLRAGSFFPSLLEPRRRIDVALKAVIMEAYVHGTSTRKVDELVSALGADTGISKSEVSRICADLDEDVAAFNTRELSGQQFPYVFVDATYCKARVGGDRTGKGSRVCSQAVVIATGVSVDGRREVLGCAVGDSETEAFWAEFLRGLRGRGLSGVRLVVSDHHLGLMNAISAVFVGAAWQRCRVHFMRNVLTRVPKGHAEMVAAAIRTVFSQPDAPAVRGQVDEVAGMLERQFPAVADMLLRLTTCVLIDAHDEWQATGRRYLSEESMTLLRATVNTAVEATPDTAEVMDKAA